MKKKHSYADFSPASLTLSFLVHVAGAKLRTPKVFCFFFGCFCLFAVSVCCCSSEQSSNLFHARPSFRSTAMESRSIQQQLRYLQDRIELLHANLQAVSSKTLSNSRTCSLEDRLNQLEQDQQPPAPSLASEILDDISRQIGIFDQQLQTLESKIKNYLDKMDEKIQCCNTKVETYQNEYYEWMEQWWKEDNLQTYRDLPSTLSH